MPKQNQKPSGASLQRKQDRAMPKKARAPKEARAEAPAQFAPVALSRKSTTSAPRVEYEKDGMSCLVSHRERIGTLNGSVAFTATSFAINPGLVASFPWLANIANRFETYQFERLEFQFRTKTATTALGDVILAADYDATDGAPTTSIQAESYQSTVSAAPWQDLNHRSTLQNLHKVKQRYVRSGSVPANSDVKLYDVGNMFVCTENQANANLVGYLYVNYRVRLYTPQLNASDFGITGGIVTGATSMTAANPFGTAPALDAQAVGFTMSTASRLTFVSPGSFLVPIQLVGTVLSVISITGTNVTVSAASATVVNAGATTAERIFICTCTAPGGYIDITATATTVTSSSAYVASGPDSSFALVAERRKQMKTDCVERSRMRQHCQELSRPDLVLVYRCPNDCPCKSPEEKCT